MNEYSYVVTRVDTDLKLMEVKYTKNDVEKLVSMPIPRINETLENVIKRYLPSFDTNNLDDQILQIESGLTGIVSVDATNFEMFDNELDRVTKTIPIANIETINKVLNLNKKYVKTLPYYNKQGSLIGIEFVMPRSDYLSTATGVAVLLEADTLVKFSKSLGLFCIAKNAKPASVKFFVDNHNAKMLERSDGYTVIYTEVDSNLLEARQSEQLQLVREKRNNLLKDTDWIFNPDVNVQNKEAWIQYRQDLRDIPQQEDFPNNIVWPTKPE